MFDQMSAVVMTGHGGPEKLEWRTDYPVPKPKRGEVLIKVSAAGINNTDINTRIGWYSKSGADAEDTAWNGKAFSFPRVQGADVCGRITAVGDGVSQERIGERVIVEPCLQEAAGKMLASPWYLGSECDGGFAEFVCVASRHAYAVESSLSDIELASFPCSYSTAENMLTRTGVSEGHRVLITGASGGVGSAAIQLANARGASVVAVTSPGKSELLEQLGAQTIIHRQADPVGELGTNAVDTVIDLVGGSSWPSLLEVLRPGGKYAVSGAIAGPLVELDLRTLYLKDLSLFGCTVLDQGVFGQLIDRIEKREIRPLVAMSFPLNEIVSAQHAFQEKAHVGKIVLEIESGDG